MIDTRPLHVRRLSVQLRISELESALASARARDEALAAELERADTIPAPPPGDPDDIPITVELDALARGPAALAAERLSDRSINRRLAVEW